MIARFNTSTNILRDADRSFQYIPTPNTVRIAKQLATEFRNGRRSFNIIGSYGTGKSSFLWAIEQVLTKKATFFPLIFLPNPSVKVFKIIGNFESLKTRLTDLLAIDLDTNNSETIFFEIFNLYRELGVNNPLLIIVIDEFGKFLEYAANNEPEQELYFIQQFAEFVNNPDNNIVLVTTVHQNFDAYATHLLHTQRQEWSKVKGRFNEITFNEPIDQLLYLAAEHLSVSPYLGQKDDEIDLLIKLLTTSKAFSIEQNYIREIAQKLYPLDVFSAYVLAMSLQKYGQNERSLFSFLESRDSTSLIRHGEIDNERFYTIVEVYDHLLQNYYSYINSRYNPDFNAWRSIKSALEKVDTLFEDRNHDYGKIVKIIGLLSINAQAGSLLDKEFIVNYCKTCLWLKDCEILIDSLERNKIIFYRRYSNKYILFEGTDLDIPGALHDAGNKIFDVIDIVGLLRKNYSLPPVLAKRALFETGTPRLFEYVISSEAIQVVPTGELDGFINLIFSETAHLQEVLDISNRHREAILYCFYQNSNEIKELLFEIEKTQRVIEENEEDKVAVSELKNIIVHQRYLLNNIILNSPFGVKSHVKWIFCGKEIQIRSQRQLNIFLSQICREIYSETPYFNNELVNKHKISASIHIARKNYFNALVSNWEKPDLGFSKDKFPPEKTIYLSLLENNGIRLDKDSSIYELPHSANGFDKLWYASEAFLGKARGSKRKLSDFVEFLTAKPFKIKQGLVDFWIPTFLFIKRNEFALFSASGYIPYITVEILDLISKRPFDFEVKTFSLDGVKLDLFNSYRTFLNQETETLATTETFIETIKPFLVFYRALPDYAKQTTRLSKESISLRTAIANSKDPEESFFDDFPTALGFSLTSIQKDNSLLHQYVSQLQQSIKEIRNCYDGLILRFESFILDNFMNNRVEFDIYQRHFQARFRALPRHLLLGQQKSFVQRLDSTIDDRNAWLSSLSKVLVDKPIDKITDRDEILLYDRFREMILSLDSLQTIAETKFDVEREVVFDLQINSFQEGMSRKLIRLPREKENGILDLQAQIVKLLTKDKMTDLAALTAVIKDLI